MYHNHYRSTARTTSHHLQAPQKSIVQPHMNPGVQTITFIFSNPSSNPPCSNFLFPPDASISSLDFFGNSLCLPRNSITNPCFIPRFLILLDSQITTYLLLFYFTLCCCRLFYAASPAIYFTPLSAAATVVCRTGRGLPLFSSFFHSRWSLLPPSTIVCGTITYAYSGFYIPIVVDVPLHGSHESRMTHTCA